MLEHVSAYDLSKKNIHYRTGRVYKKNITLFLEMQWVCYCNAGHDGN